MKLKILGSGTCVPSLSRNAPGYFLEAEECRVLVDCGSGTLLQLERAGESYREIDAVFITHRHPDHFADLMPLIHALIATPDFQREQPLTIIAPEGFKEYCDRAIGSLINRYLNFRLTFVTMPESMEYGPFQVYSAKTDHSDDSIAYRFEHNGRTIVFSGDTDYDQGIISLSEKADLLVADCSFPHSMKAKGHLSAKECGLVAQKAGVKRLLLSHIYPAGLPDIERVSESKEVYAGEVLLAADLMEIAI